MKLYFTLTKRKLAVILAVTIITLILLAQFFSTKSGVIDGSTNAKRVEYLLRLGFNVDETATNIKKIVIPENFGKVYKNYNNLQLKSGFNLKNYKGKQATVYTYSATDQEVIHLIVCKDEIIGGDIENINVDGEMYSLKRENE